MEKFIYLVPIGEVKREILEDLKNNLPKVFPFKFVIADEIPIPKDSFNEKRKQYLAYSFLEELSKLNINAYKILGVTNVDLYAPSLNYVFGQAKLGGREGVISLARLDNSFYGFSECLSVLKHRALKEAVHELGHCFGLEHCTNSNCVMYFSNSLKDTDNKDYNFCYLCNIKFYKILENLQILK